jgi:GH43 family beta-xylosidase
VFHTRALTAIALLACGVVTAQTPQPALNPIVKAPSALVNPLLNSGPDPWITYRGGFYYYMNTTANSLKIWKTRSLADLAHAESKAVWLPPASGPYSRDVWAPELHFLRGKWYIYFAADAGTNASHRIWALENDSADPLSGEWRMKGKVADASDRWAIDATVFEEGSRMFMIWSGWEGDTNVAQNLYIAELSDPWTIKGPRVKISSPEYPWEKVGDLTARRNPEENPGLNRLDPPHVEVNEGPEILRHGENIFVIYSAAGCWTDFYSMGLLAARAGGDLLNPASWKKSPIPVFWQSARANAYGTGHGSFFQSPDGTEDWMLYHANPQPSQGCGGHRSPRAQRFTWNADGTPDFGRPIGIGVPLDAPSGEWH